MAARLKRILLATPFLLGTVLLSQASAAPIASFTYVETALPGGLYQYDYTLTNLGDPVTDAGRNLYDVTLFFTGAGPISSAAPASWDIISGLNFAEWFSLVHGIPPAGADVAPGTSLSGFRAVFDRAIGPVSFEALFVNPAAPTNPILFSGVTSETVVTPIPEPAALVLLATGLGSLVARRRRI